MSAPRGTHRNGLRLLAVLTLAIALFGAAGSLPAGAATRTAAPTVAPGMPGSFKVKAHNQKARASWKAPSNAQAAQVVSYHVALVALDGTVLDAVDTARTSAGLVLPLSMKDTPVGQTPTLYVVQLTAVGSTGMTSTLEWTYVTLHYR